MRGSFYFEPNDKSFNEFYGQCAVAINRIGNGSRKALVAACEEILEASLMQVPYDTGTLASSAAYEITGSYKTRWEADIGYGNHYDPINPKTGKPASSYAITVHEDLHAHHPLGKAKYLEDPVRDYAAEKYPRTVFKYAKESLAGLSE